MHQLETRLDKARERVRGPAGASASAKFELANAAWETGRPSEAEPLLRALTDDPDVGMASIRLLAELLVATERPAEAEQLAGRLDDSGSSQLLRAWIGAHQGHHQAGPQALATLQEMTDPSISDRRIAHQAAAMGRDELYPDALFEWIAWLRDNAPERGGVDQVADAGALEDIEAWTTALEISMALDARPAQLLGLPAVLLGLAMPLPHAHQVRSRAFLASATALAATNPETSIVILDDVRRHIASSDPLFREGLEHRVQTLEELVGRPTSRLIKPGLRALVVSRSGFALSSDLEDRPLDLYACLMKAATARDLCRALKQPATSWTGDDIGLSFEADPEGVSGVLRFSAVHPDSDDLALSLDRHELDEILSFAQEHGFAPAFAAGVGRNDPCPCGSGRKYKRCCGA